VNGQRKARAQASEPSAVCGVGQWKKEYAMGDKGKKDKDKARKQKIKKQAQTAKTSLEKLPTKIPA
jgi:hypothetical protein